MALLNRFTNDRNGLNIPNAYTIVSSMMWDKKLNVASAQLDVYVTQQVRDDNLINGSIGQFSIILPMNVVTIDQVYTYVKTLPEFAAAVDA